jgi:hypothetical protein
MCYDESASSVEPVIGCWILSLALSARGGLGGSKNMWMCWWKSHIGSDNI